MEESTSLGRENLKKDVEDYVETKIDLIKLKTIEKVGTAASGAVVGISSAILGLFFLFFLSTAGAIGIGYLINNYFLGFLFIALFYGVLMAGIILFRERLITFPIVKMLLKKFYYPNPELADRREKQ